MATFETIRGGGSATLGGMREALATLPHVATLLADHAILKAQLNEEAAERARIEARIADQESRIEERDSERARLEAEGAQLRAEGAQRRREIARLEERRGAQLQATLAQQADHLWAETPYD